MPRGPSPSSQDHRLRTRKRLAVALTASLVAHVMLVPRITGGSARAHKAGSEPSVLSARLVHTEPPPAEALAEIVPPPVPRPERRAPPLRIRETPSREPAPTPAPPAAPSPAGGIPEAPDLTYYGTRQLDVYPQLASALDLEATRRVVTNATARALLLVLINALGSVDDVTVVEAEAPDELADTKRALLSARFTPAYRNGKPVRSRLLVEITFGRDDAPR